MLRIISKVVVKLYIAVALVAVIAVSCQKQEEQALAESGDEIVFNVEMNDGFALKSAGENSGESGYASREFFLCSFGTDSVCMTLSEGANSVKWANDPDTLDVGTKGAPIEDPSGGDAYALKEFWISALLDDGSLYFPETNFEISGSEAINSQRYWPEDEALNFYAYAPEEAKKGVEGLDYSFANGKLKGSFSYSMPVDNVEGNDAEILPDYIYTIVSGKTKTKESVGLVFHHAFSAICFKVGSMPENVQVTHIALRNIFSEGVCSFEENDETGIYFNWTGQAELKDFVQSLNVQVDGASSSGEALTTKEQTFMVVPQTLPEDAEIEIGFTINGAERSLSKKIKEVNPKWEADKKYIYSISIQSDLVDIEVTDEVAGAVKSNVKITNTGNIPVYIRAMVVGYWSVGNYIVSAWKDTDGTFVYSSAWSNYWIKGADGFYYYKYPLLPDKTPTVPIFDSYTLQAPPPYARASLQLNVMSQAVDASTINDASWPWPVKIADGLVEDPEQL
ncbi:MAG: fimbrillin family protein [Bacteroidales bacterium]|nr:fimbrillin family protein [Bacteroidales bacterium]